jgi:hypothetical protein
MNNMSPSEQACIQAANWLGYAGALPFLCFGLVIIYTEVGIAPVTAADVQFALLSYGAIILSFLGGLHWGRAIIMPADTNVISPRTTLLWSVSLSLVGWVALLLPVFIGAILLFAGFLVALVVDLMWLAKGYWPFWMRRLRLHLSLIAMASLVCLAYQNMVLPS